MNSKLLISLAIAFGIGVACRLAKLPVPSPPTLQGALLVVAITLGYIVSGQLLK